MIVCVIPARGGSERVPGKNLHPLRGRPLLSYAVAAALDAGLAPEVFVSTDAPAIAEAARTAGAAVIDRPAELSTAASSTEAALLHALDVLEEQGRAYEWVVTLPPTSPLRTGATVRRVVDRALASPDADSCFSVHECRGDFWVEETAGQFRRLFPDAPRRQQDRVPLLEEDSAVYVTRVQALRETGFILGRRPEPVLISAREGFDVNTADDLLVADALLTAT